MRSVPLLPRHPWPARQERLQEALAGAGHDAMLVTNPVNVRYLSGFAGPGLLVVTSAAVHLITDHRYVEVARAMLTEERAGFRLAAGSTSSEQLRTVRELLSEGVRMLIEADHVTLSRADALRDGLPGIELVPSTRVVEEHRLIKDEAEIARLRAAADIADAVLDDVLGEIRPGITTERDVADRLASRARELGADGEAFPAIVAAGEHGGSPHSTPSDRRIEAREPVIIDFGTTVDGYRSDMTRTIWFGELPDEAAEVYALVRQAQEHGVAAAAAGATHAAVDERCRTTIEAGGHAEHFTHPTGHNVGLDIHELPYLTSRSTEPLRHHQVITVEPGVYLAGRFGVRIEDMGVVTGGQFDVLTRTPKLTAPAGLALR